MFSANENLLLRQHKRRVVGYVEATMTESVLDYGVNVMVMQVQCTAPGCVPIETCIVIVFPASKVELIPGLPESAGGSYKTKVLKPMAEIEPDDVLDVLPPVFIGGKKPTLDELCIRVRDVMLGQITQVFGDLDVDGRTLVARYLQSSLDDYVGNDCEPPEWGATAFPKTKTAGAAVVDTADTGANAIVAAATASASVETSSGGINRSNATTVSDTPSPPDVAVNAGITDSTTTNTATTDVWKNGKGNVTLPRPVDAISNASFVQPQQKQPPLVVQNKSLDSRVVAGATAGAAASSSAAVQTSISTVNSSTQKRQQQLAERALRQQQYSGGSAIGGNGTSSSSALLLQLSQREHAPGIRRAGCPCCDPDNLSTIVDTMLSQL